MQDAFLITALIAAVYCGAYFITVRRSGSFLFILPLLSYALVYGYGLTRTADIAVDDSIPSIHEATVIGKYITYGKSHSPIDYYLQVRPWDPETDISRVKVPAMIYGSYAPGDTACLGLHLGLLHLQWYELIACPADNPAPQP
jgi:hypothetical protein